MIPTATPMNVVIVLGVADVGCSSVLGAFPGRLVKPTRPVPVPRWIFSLDDEPPTVIMDPCSDVPSKGFAPTKFEFRFRSPASPSQSNAGSKSRNLGQYRSNLFRYFRSLHYIHNNILHPNSFKGRLYSRDIKTIRAARTHPVEDEAAW